MKLRVSVWLAVSTRWGSFQSKQGGQRRFTEGHPMRETMSYLTRFQGVRRWAPVELYF